MGDTTFYIQFQIFKLQKKKRQFQISMLKLGFASMNYPFHSTSAYLSSLLRENNIVAIQSTEMAIKSEDNTDLGE